MHGAYIVHTCMYACVGQWACLSIIYTHYHALLQFSYKRSVHIIFSAATRAAAAAVANEPVLYVQQFSLA